MSFAVRESTIYPILSRLRHEGYLKVRTASSPDGPPRHYFSLMEAGKKRLQEMNQYWDHLNQSVTVMTGNHKNTR
jgi:PadR family transcriptional regulator PadR